MTDLSAGGLGVHGGGGVRRLPGEAQRADTNSLSDRSTCFSTLPGLGAPEGHTAAPGSSPGTEVDGLMNRRDVAPGHVNV